MNRFCKISSVSLERKRYFVALSIAFLGGSGPGCAKNG